MVVNDDDHDREAIRAVLEDDGRVVESLGSCEAFLKAFDPGKSACLLVDAYLPGTSGLELLEKLHHDGHSLPAIMITSNADVAHGGSGHESGRAGFHRKADRPRGTHHWHRAGSHGKLLSNGGFGADPKAPGTRHETPRR